MIRRALLAVVFTGAAACASPQSDSYLFVWAGDADGKASDFLGVIDATPTSPTYGGIVASMPVGQSGTHPHHTEQEMPPNAHLLANGFAAGNTWLFDLTQPLHPRILTSFGDKGGFSHPHSFVRLENGQVLATFQYAAGEGASPPHGGDHAAAASKAPRTGGLVLMDERGEVIRSGSARDPSIQYTYIYPYHVLPLPAFDRALSTTTDTDPKNAPATSEWVQLWRLSDLTLLKSFALPPGPRGDEHKLTGELRLLPDGKSAYVHTFSCGLYLLRDLDAVQPRATFVKSFQGLECGVPLLTGHYWLQPVPAAHALVALDISDPEHPREVSTVTVGDEEGPHWIAIDPTGRRVVLNSGGYAKSNRLFLIDFDPATGRLTVDDRFRHAGNTRPGIDLTGKTWPHGTVFSR